MRIVVPGPGGNDANAPTLTAVLLSSSDALLPPPCLLFVLNRLLLLGVRMMALIGRCDAPVGDAGGETVMSSVYRLTGSIAS